MNINPHIFRAYDIRGIAHEDLTEEVMYQIGLGSGTYLQRISGKKVVVGRDNRTHGEKLQKAFIQGLLDTGCDVTNIGISTSPLVYFSVCHYGFDGGVNITASHNPKEYNGVKIVSKGAEAICDKELLDIYELIKKQDFIKGKGQLTEKDIFPEYIDEIKKLVTIDRKLKVVVDAGNGTTGKFAPELLTALGVEVVPLYCELDGTFPNHEANPEDYENVKDLIEEVKKQDADLGIAFDGDGDRVGVVDKYGTHYSADYLLILLARDLLTRHPGAKIVFDVKCSKILDSCIENAGGVPLMTKTGHSFIERRMKQEGALIAGEVSGHMFFAENYYGFDDAFLAAVKVLSVFAKSGVEDFKDLFKDIPELYTTPEIKLHCPDDIKFKLLEDIKNYYCQKYDCITIDGVRINFDEDSWGLIRCSNTSPNISLRFESKDQSNLRDILQIVYSKLKEYPEVDLKYFDRYLLNGS